MSQFQDDATATGLGPEDSSNDPPGALRARLAVAGDLAAPAAARRFVADELEGAGLVTAVPVFEVVLVVSELVTNAVRAGSTSVEVFLDHDEDQLVLGVQDDADGLPQEFDAEPDAVRGRGLAIVEQLAESWRTISRPPFKQVVATWTSF